MQLTYFTLVRWTVCVLSCTSLFDAHGRPTVSPTFVEKRLNDKRGPNCLSQTHDLMTCLGAWQGDFQ